MRAFLHPATLATQALAPTGKLGVGLYPGTPTSIIGDPASGNAKGVGFELGRALAQRAGIPFGPLVFPNNAEVLAAAKAGSVDMVFTNATPAGRWGLESFAIGIPKGREAAIPFVSSFVSEAKFNGAVARAVERAGLRGTVSPD